MLLSITTDRSIIDYFLLSDIINFAVLQKKIKKMGDKFRSLWKYIAGGSSVLAYQSWYDNYINKQTTANLSERILNMEESIKSIDSKIDNCTKSDLKIKLLEQKRAIQEKLRSLYDIHTEWSEKVKAAAGDSKKTTEIFEKYEPLFRETFKSAEKQAEEMDKILSVDSNFKKFIDDNFILDYIKLLLFGIMSVW